MRKIIIILIVIFSFSCKNETNNIEEKITKNKKIDSENNTLGELNLITCDEFIRKIIFSSNLQSIKNYKDIFIRLENISEKKIKIELYIKNNLAENSNETQIVENAVSWLEFSLENRKLFDVTYNPENPIEINFDKKIFDKYDLDKICGFKINQNSEEDFNDEVQCKSIKGEMLSGEECIFLNSSIKSVYKDILTKKLVEEVEYLMEDIPSQNKSFKINKNGLIEINYVVSENKIDINMEYEGGVTTIFIEARTNDIIRKITRSAD